MVNRDFTVHGLQFHLNDGRGGEYDAKYCVMVRSEYDGKWYECIFSDTKKEAMQRLNDLYKRHLQPFFD